MAKASGFLYQLSRLIRDLEVIFSGSPKKLGKRGINKLIGRKIVRRMYLK